MRRVVTGHAPSGKSVFIADGEPPVHVAPDGVGLDIVKLWVTEGIPSLPVPTGEPTTEPHLYFPGPGGTRFLLVSISPASDAEDAIRRGVDLAKSAQELHDRLPGLTDVMEHDNPGMHTSHTIDYGIILSGEIDLELDDGATTRLQAGDYYVQNGTRHRWSNPGSVPCVLAVVVVGAA